MGYKPVTEPKFELCSVCYDETGKESAGEDSIFWLDRAIGPLCDTCNLLLISEITGNKGMPACGLCGWLGADKIPHPIRWPGETDPGTEYIHAECEDRECRRAHAALTDQQRQDFLRSL